MRFKNLIHKFYIKIIGLVNIDDNEDDEKKVGGFKSNKIAPEPSLSQSQRKNDITSVNNSQVNLRQ